MRDNWLSNRVFQSYADICSATIRMGRQRQTG